MMNRLACLGCLAITLSITSCGGESGNESADTAPDPDQVQAAMEVAEEILRREPNPEECGQGGTACPEGLECVTWRGGVQACGPKAVEGLVLIKDATLGGSCLMHSDADAFPGASIASVKVIDTDGSVLGWGRLVWDEPGFEVASERGNPPDGSEFTGDACTTSYNLGCDGKAAFEIVDVSGQAQKLREGQNLIVHIRGSQTCGDKFEDSIEAAICTDTRAVRNGTLDSCSWKVRTVELNRDEYGPDRLGGTLGN